MGRYRDVLRAHQADINRLNVYPVPDGDTGTNMALTLEAVVAELDGVPSGSALPEVCRAIGHGSLMGARGNSGVILSQLLRGMCERMGGAGEAGVDGPVLADALAHAADLARRAVVRPVEGTILTVASAAAEGAAEVPAGAGRRWSAWWRRRTARRPMPWRGRPRCWRCWPRPAWSMRVAPGSCSCSMPAGRSSTGRTSCPEPSAAPAGRSRGAGRTNEADEGAHDVGDLATRSCTSSTPRTTPWRTSRRCGPESGTRSSSSAGTGCGTATSTPTTSGPRSRRAWTPGAPSGSG